MLVDRAESLMFDCQAGAGPGPRHDPRPPHEFDRRRMMTHRGPSIGMPQLGASQYVVGWAQYRAGNYGQAVQTLRSVCRDRWPSREIARPILAMAYHKLGKQAEAEATLEQSQLQLDQWLEKAMNSDRATVIPWVDWIEFLVNHREATHLITSKPLADDPRLAKLRERSLTSLN